jgi:hypothetical protein
MAVRTEVHVRTSGVAALAAGKRREADVAVPSLLVRRVVNFAVSDVQQLSLPGLQVDHGHTTWNSALNLTALYQMMTLSS